MKYIVPFFALLILFSSAMQAQKMGMDPEKRAERQTMHMKGYLDLDDDQVAKVRTANMEMAEKIKEINEEIFEMHKTRMDAVHAERSKVLKGILNDEQYEQWMEKEEEMMKDRPFGPHKPGPHKRNWEDQDLENKE